MLNVATCFKETALLFNVHLSCFVDFILCPTDKYMFKVSNKKIKINLLNEFKVKDKYSMTLVLVFLLLTLATVSISI